MITKKVATLLLFVSSLTNAQEVFFEDNIREEKNDSTVFFTSPAVDFIQIPSTISDSVCFAIAVYKPSQPSPILLMSHGWHMSVKKPDKKSVNPFPGFLTIQVDMRGRAFSTGKPDCSGYELYDFYDALLYARENYAAHISNPEQIYFVGGSGGGGNGFALVGKFPDLFTSAFISYGMSDYALWYEQDTVGEFRDDMISWIGGNPSEKPEAYASRSGITSVENVCSKLFIMHGETDIRVPVNHSRLYVERAKELEKNIEYLELKGVGTRNHTGNITKEQIDTLKKFTEMALSYKVLPQLPLSGELIVPGYVVTKHFSVFMESIDRVGKVYFNIVKKEIIVIDGKIKKIVFNSP